MFDLPRRYHLFSFHMHLPGITLLIYTFGETLHELYTLNELQTALNPVNTVVAQGPDKLTWNEFLKLQQKSKQECYR